MTSLRRFTPTLRALVAALLAVACSPAPGADASLDRDLLRAAAAGSTSEVQSLLQAGANPRFQDHSGSSALMRAAERGSTDIVQALLAAKADVNASASGWTALLFAANRGHLEVVRLLLAAGAAPDPAAAELGGGRTPLMLALSIGRLDLAQLLIEGGANVNATTNYGATPLRFAVWGSTPEHVRMIRTLVAAGADVDAGHAPSFRVKPAAACVRLVESAPCLVVGSRGPAEGTALGDIAASSRSGNSDIMRTLLAAGAKVDARQPGWKTPLMLAAAAGSLSGVQLLLDARADVNAKDSEERTALMLAQESGHQEVAELLRIAGNSKR